MKDLEGVEEKREKLEKKIQSDMDKIASALPGKYGKFSLSTENGKWTMKHDRGECQWLLFSGDSKVYVISQYDPPDITEFLNAVKDYKNFVKRYDEWIEDIKEKLGMEPEEIDTDRLDEVNNKMDELLDDIRSEMDALAQALPERYGKLSMETEKGKWTLKHDKGSCKWLRLKNNYVISQKGSDTIPQMLWALEDYNNFVEKVNEYIKELDEDIDALKGV